MRDQDFWGQVLKIPGGCWEWQGPLRSWNGYGRVVVDGKHWRVHRYSYAVLVGPIENGLTVDHVCQNRLCVDPAHMQLVSARENGNLSWIRQGLTRNAVAEGW